MRFKPKEVLVLLPQIIMLESEDEAALLAANFNTFVHGKIHLKYEVLGILNSKQAVLFYMQRNHESQQLRNEIMTLINQEELSAPFDPIEKSIEEEKKLNNLSREMDVEWDGTY